MGLLCRDVLNDQFLPVRLDVKPLARHDCVGDWGFRHNVPRAQRSHEPRRGRARRPWLVVIGTIRLRQLADRMRHSLTFIPAMYVVAAIAIVQALLWIDQQLTDESLPIVLETTVDSARSVFAAIAGGLITSITLLLSMMLVAVQLASSQFSPRTLRNWLGNRTIQHAVGFVLGTTVFCLLALRSTRSFGEDEHAIVPHLTVLVAVALAVMSLVAVVRTVDHIAHGVQVGTIAERVANETIGVIERVYRTEPDSIKVGVDSGAIRTDGSIDVPVGATAIEAPTTGWVQQVDTDVVIDSLPEHSTGYLTANVGTFVMDRSPIMWVAPAPTDPAACQTSMLQAIAFGDSRTMQQDVEFGIIQLTDIAVRALSPGVNDPSTATDIIVHLGNVMAALWERPALSTTLRSGSRTLIHHRPTHPELLDRAFSPIIQYGSSDRQVVSTLRQVLTLLRSEVDRRNLPGPIEPLDDMLAALG